MVSLSALAGCVVGQERVGPKLMRKRKVHGRSVLDKITNLPGPQNPKGSPLPRAELIGVSRQRKKVRVRASRLKTEAVLQR